MKTVSRKRWLAMKGEFFINSTLYLPEDLKNYELIKIMRRIDRMTYAEDVPVASGTGRMVQFLEEYKQELSS